MPCPAQPLALSWAYLAGTNSITASAGVSGTLADALCPGTRYIFHCRLYLSRCQPVFIRMCRMLGKMDQMTSLREFTHDS